MKYYLYLLYQLSRRDVAARYRGSVMGVLWSLVSPVVMLTVYTFVFSVVFKARWGIGGDDKLAFALNVFAGIIVHGFFAECVNRAPGLMLQYTSYVKRVVFPLWILPPVVLVSALFHALISLLVLLAAYVCIYGHIHWQLIMLPVVMLPLILVTLGVAWFMAALGVFLRDIGQVVPVLMTVMMFMAPVFYPVSALPEAYQGWLYLNPLTPSIEMMRNLLLGGLLPQPAAYLAYLALAVLCAALGGLFFRRTRRGFADVL
ncbi:ABC transporter permease [Ectopseudomonas khazarica]|uniref:ABC transporter permease n=1 Tax=Ectopseudomonas khazarica TaxID=2502979 RepID=UPI000689F86C|nr:ABC transporter permease [Pseudomonas khazarica]QTS87145.1 ABC transporter permease [Pseudomonas khazarica]